MPKAGLFIGSTRQLCFNFHQIQKAPPKRGFFILSTRFFYA